MGVTRRHRAIGRSCERSHRGSPAVCGAEVLAMKATDAAEVVHGRAKIVAGNEGCLVAKRLLGLCIVPGGIVVCCVWTRQDQPDKTNKARSLSSARDVVERACMRR